MQRLKNWISQKWQKFKNSKFFLAVIMLAIGISYTYCYLTIKYEYKEIFGGRTVVILNNNSSVALAETKVETGSKQEIEKITSPEVRGEEQSSPTIELIKKAFPENFETMLAIAKAESRLRPDAVNINKNGSKDCGIFQINSVHGYDCEWLKNPSNNIKVAREVYEKQGLKAWSTWNYAQAHNRPIF